MCVELRSVWDMLHSLHLGRLHTIWQCLSINGKLIACKLALCHLSTAKQKMLGLLSNVIHGLGPESLAGSLDVYTEDCIPTIQDLLKMQGSTPAQPYDRVTTPNNSSLVIFCFATVCPMKPKTPTNSRLCIATRSIKHADVIRWPALQQDPALCTIHRPAGYAVHVILTHCLVTFS